MTDGPNTTSRDPGTARNPGPPPSVGPVSSGGPGSTVSTRSRDEIEKDIQERREQSSRSSDGSDAPTDTAAIRERTRHQAEEHRAQHLGEPKPPRLSARDDREKSSAELEREVEHERAQLTRTLDEIRGKFSFGQIIDQGVRFAQESGGGEFTRNLGRSVRENPLPVAFIGAGIGWHLLAGRMDHSTSHRPDNAGGTDRHVNGAQNGHGGGHELSDRAHEISHRASEMADDARSRIQGAGERARRGLVHMAEEQPLVLGAIGLAAGAAIAAMFPSSRTENRVMGETSDMVKDETKAAAAREFDHVKTVAKETTQDAVDEFKSRGISAESAKEATAAAAEKVEEGARRMAHDGKSDGGTKNQNANGTHAEPARDKSDAAPSTPNRSGTKTDR